MKPKFQERVTAADWIWREKVIRPHEICTSVAFSAALLLAAFCAG